MIVIGSAQLVLKIENLSCPPNLNFLLRYPVPRKLILLNMKNRLRLRFVYFLLLLLQKIPPSCAPSLFRAKNRRHLHLNLKSQPQSRNILFLSRAAPSRNLCFPAFRLSLKTPTHIQAQSWAHMSR